MQPVAKVFLWGMLISLLGSLPLGTLNITAMQIGIQENIPAAIYFAIGCLLAEMFYVRVSLVGINRVIKHQRIMKALEWLTLFIIILLAAGSFMAASNPDGGKNVVLTVGTNRFLLGILLSALNPLQIPFWFGWSSVLFQKKILQPTSIFYNWYITGIGIGTLAGNSLFIFGGRYAATKIGQSQAYINWAIGSVFLVTAIIQLYQLLFKKSRLTHLDHSTNR